MHASHIEKDGGSGQPKILKVLSKIHKMLMRGEGRVRIELSPITSHKSPLIRAILSWTVRVTLYIDWFPTRASAVLLQHPQIRVSLHSYAVIAKRTE